MKVHDASSKAASLSTMPRPPEHRLKMLRALERKVHWLSTWMIHHANLIRPNPDGLKVGGHQASSASVVTLMTALYFEVLRSSDRVAVKPHASPVYHAIQYLLGRQSKERLQRFRALGGAQAYPSRTKDADDVDISTGSMGMGAAQTIFASLIQDYVESKAWLSDDRPPGRNIAIVGDAELDEGNVFEALFEGWKCGLRNVWWIIDYNRQSLDRVVEDQLASRMHQMFEMLDWRVIVLKYGQQLERAFKASAGTALREWIDNCPNSLYSALVFQGGAAWRERLQRDLSAERGIDQLLDEYDDEQLQGLMTNLAGHDMEMVLDTFHSIDDERPTAIVAYTIKGFGLPLAGHKDNHSGLLSPRDMEQLRESLGIAAGDEWEPFAGVDIPRREVTEFIQSVPFIQQPVRRHRAPVLSLQSEVKVPIGEKISTQAAFGRLLNEYARLDDPLAAHILTMAPDVASSTNLGPWITKRGIFDRRDRPNPFADEKIRSTMPWSVGPNGQHVELGIAETNLFVLLSAAGLAAENHGVRLFPIGTVYDPFICRGLDALNYACYQNARFMLVGTPSGVTLSPEGGAHQSIYTPLIGVGQPGLTYFEPAYADELCEIVKWSLNHLQAEDGGSVYLRLSTRALEQSQREMTSELRTSILNGGYWLVPPSDDTTHVIVAMGAVLPEAVAAHRELLNQGRTTGLLVVTSPDVLCQQWCKRIGSTNQSQSNQLNAAHLLNCVDPRVTLVTVLDGHPLSLAWLGATAGYRVRPLGVSSFGMSGYVSELYREQGIDTATIVQAVLGDLAPGATAK